MCFNAELVRRVTQTNITFFTKDTIETTSHLKKIICIDTKKYTIDGGWGRGADIN